MCSILKGFTSQLWLVSFYTKIDNKINLKSILKCASCAPKLSPLLLTGVYLFPTTLILNPFTMSGVLIKVLSTCGWDLYAGCVFVQSSVWCTRSRIKVLGWLRRSSLQLCLFSGWCALQSNMNTFLVSYQCARPLHAVVAIIGGTFFKS